MFQSLALLEDPQILPLDKPLSPTVQWAKVAKVSQASWREEVEMSAKQTVDIANNIWREGSKKRGAGELVEERDIIFSRLGSWKASNPGAVPEGEE